MATARTQTIRLRPETYQALEDEAERRHVGPEELAEEIVRDKLQPSELHPGYLDQALNALDELSHEMPALDAVQLVRQSREELELRARRWQSS